MKGGNPPRDNMFKKYIKLSLYQWSLTNFLLIYNITVNNIILYIIKYNMQTCSLIIDDTINHPVCLIEEYVYIINTRNSLILPTEPTINLKINLININLLKVKLIINIKGAIFCQVNIMNSWKLLKCSTITGNQKWKGEAPNFNNKAININLLNKK